MLTVTTRNATTTFILRDGGTERIGVVGVIEVAAGIAGGAAGIAGGAAGFAGEATGGEEEVRLVCRAAEAGAANTGLSVAGAGVVETACSAVFVGCWCGNFGSLGVGRE
jgi:hypothetical protein